MKTQPPLKTPEMKTSDHKDAALPKKFKSVPENWKALPESTYRHVIADLETVLFDISADGIGINTPDGNISASTLNRWAEHLRNALALLSKGQ